MNRKYIYAPLSIIVFGILHLLTAVTTLLSLLFAYLKLKSLVFICIKYWAKSLFWILGHPLKVKGKNNFNPEKKYILLANHSSLFDIPAIISFFPSASWFGRKSLMNIPVFGQILKMTDYIPMEAGSIRNTKGMLNNLINNSHSKTIAIFPEGTRTLDGNLRKFRRGFIYVLKSSNRDLLPVTLNGLFRLKPKTRFWIDFGAKIDIEIHTPIERQTLINKSDEDIMMRIKNVLAENYHQ